MARMNEHQHLYDVFNIFPENCIIKGISIIDNSKKIFTTSNINTCIQKFVNDYKDDKRDYQEKIKEQFDGTSDDAKMVFAHANWL